MADTDKGIGLLIWAAVAIIVGLVIFTGAIAPSVGQATTRQTNVNESVSIVPARIASGELSIVAFNVTAVASNKLIGTAGYEWRTAYPGQCNVTSFTIYNNSGTAGVITTDYNYNADTGKVQFLNTSVFNQVGGKNTTSVTYTYCQDGYIGDSGGRAMANLIPIFTVLIVLVIAVALVMKNKEEYM